MFYCTNRARYADIARKHNSSSWNVYHIAHGKKVRTLRDGSIHRELHRQGIIS